MSDPIENHGTPDDQARADGTEANTEPNPPLPQLYGQDMQGHDAADAETGEDVARAEREPDDD